MHWFYIFLQVLPDPQACMQMALFQRSPVATYLCHERRSDPRQQAEGHRLLADRVDHARILQLPAAGAAIVDRPLGLQGT
jgi:hypothetical protein